MHTGSWTTPCLWALFCLNSTFSILDLCSVQYLLSREAFHSNLLTLSCLTLLPSCFDLNSSFSAAGQRWTTKCRVGHRYVRWTKTHIYLLLYYYKSLSKNCSIVFRQRDNLWFWRPNNLMYFAFQREVYERTTQQLIADVLAGFNATVFAYGPTGNIVT